MYDVQAGQSNERCLLQRQKMDTTFVTGPLDRLHNPYIYFFCQICKTNVSIYSKGAREILRHYQKESHLRKNYSCRYEHLSTIDSATGEVLHYVKGKDGHRLSPLELAKELPLFINAPLVDIGDKLPFYDDFLANQHALGNPEEHRQAAQMFLTCTFVPSDENLGLLQTLWGRVGEFMNHQTLFADFAKDSATVTVGFYFRPAHLGVIWSQTDSYFSFQTIFQHIFICGVEDISAQVAKTGMFTLEFETKGAHRYLSIRYWHDDFLTKVQLFRHEVTDEASTCFLSAMPRVLSVLSSSSSLVSISGCPSVNIKTLDRSGLFVHGVLYFFRFNPRTFTPLLRQTGGKIFGPIELCSQLHYRILFLSGCLSQPWTQQTLELCKVCSI